MDEIIGHLEDHKNQEGVPFRIFKIGDLKLFLFGSGQVWGPPNPNDGHVCTKICHTSEFVQVGSWVTKDTQISFSVFMLGRFVAAIPVDFLPSPVYRYVENGSFDLLVTKSILTQGGVPNNTELFLYLLTQTFTLDSVEVKAEESGATCYKATLPHGQIVKFYDSTMDEVIESVNETTYRVKKDLTFQLEDDGSYLLIAPRVSSFWQT